ncbi:Mrp35 protein [Saccharomycopsis crataegensis]|uniref:Mrp35 protein n=1 Tax=Saccharomycopsis crataegensis TaxID=43959 RepID=A0AAV5QSU3_9ASCO|nr:Mrp35 protein [Saccharomycopsis crataegensis]
MFGSLLSKLQILNTCAFSGARTPVTTVFTRGMMKTHKGAAKRWIKTAKGFKRGKVGRKHGNAGWSQRLLQHKDGKTESMGKGHGDMNKRLKRLLPYH